MTYTLVVISSPALCGCLSSEGGILYRSRGSHKISITKGKEQKNAEILKGSMREYAEILKGFIWEYAEILKGLMWEYAEILKETNLTINVIFGYLAHFRLVIWRVFVWLFGAFSFAVFRLSTFG